MPPRMKAPTKLSRAHYSGVTLIELVVAVAILAIGSAAAWGSFDVVRRGIGGQAARALAQEVALNQAALLRLGDMQSRRDASLLPDRVVQGGIDWHIRTSTEATEGAWAQTEISVTAPGKPGARLIVWLPISEAGR